MAKEDGKHVKVSSWGASEGCWDGLREVYEEPSDWELLKETHPSA